LKTLIVTGGAGFIGSNFILYMLEKYQDYKILNLDKLTYAANKEYLNSVATDPRYELVVGDILDRDLVMRLFSERDVEGVVHFAAESHVDNSISGPAVFIETNIKGTLTLLEAARAHWMDAPFKPKAGKEIAGSYTSVPMKFTARSAKPGFSVKTLLMHRIAHTAPRRRGATFSRAPGTILTD
jgi:dTDP-glucose 4,6-dehydratase